MVNSSFHKVKVQTSAKLLKQDADAFLTFISAVVLYSLYEYFTQKSSKEHLPWKIQKSTHRESYLLINPQPLYIYFKSSSCYSSSFFAAKHCGWSGFLFLIEVQWSYNVTGYTYCLPLMTESEWCHVLQTPVVWKVILLLLIWRAD